MSAILQTATILLLTAVCAVVGMDPVTEIFTWFSGLATFTIVILMLLVSMAVVVWFRTRPDLTVSTWKRLVAPTLSFLGLGTALFFIVTNFTVLFGSASVAWIMAVSAPVVFVLGAVFATFVPEYDDKVITRNMAKRMDRDKSGDQG
jgi:hypothetical protein